MFQPDIVFVDTSVFIAENFFAPGNRIHSLANLAKEGRIRLVVSEITRQEVLKHIKTIVRQSWKAFNNDSRIFRNNSDVDMWRKSTNEKAEVERITGLFELFLTDTHSRILDYSYCVYAEKVFTDYFQYRKPFGEGQKKDEFPDAFVLTSLEKYSEEQHQQIIVLSTDSDMKGYESKRLVYEDYGKYISRKVAEGVALDEMAKALRDEKIVIVREITDAASDFLDDFRLYLTKLNLMEVSDHSIERVEVNYNEDDYEIISVSEDSIELEIEPEIIFKVDVSYVNYDYAFYDKEDGIWYGTEDGHYEVDAAASVRATLRFCPATTFGVPFFKIEDLDLSSLSDAIE